MIIQNGNIFTLNGTFSVGTIKVAKDKIAQLDMTPAYEAIDKTTGETIIDARGLYVLPGLVDIHTHGAVGVDFCDAKQEELCKLEAYQAQNGVTTIFATTMTLPEEKLLSIIEKTAEFVKNYLCKGKKIAVRGELVTSNYKDEKTGQTVYTTEIHAQEIEFADKKDKENADKMPPPCPDDNGFTHVPDVDLGDLPFK